MFIAKRVVLTAKATNSFWGNDSTQISFLKLFYFIDFFVHVQLFIVCNYIYTVLCRTQVQVHQVIHQLLQQLAQNKKMTIWQEVLEYHTDSFFGGQYLEKASLHTVTC